jgi:26S proteasome regulatory subunit N2
MLNTATGYLALLQEQDLDIKSIALDKINILVDDYWAEIADYIQDIEELYRSNLLPDKKNLIALIISKIYYNLEEYNQAIEWALEAGDKFDILEKSQFVSTILKKIIERYISHSQKNFFSEDKIDIDDRILKIVDRIFNRSLENKAFNQAIGFSLETYDINRVIFIVYF